MASRIKENLNKKDGVIKEGDSDNSQDSEKFNNELFENIEDSEKKKQEHS